MSIFRANELLNRSIYFGKDEARFLLNKAGIKESEFLDRLNLEALLAFFFKSKVSVLSGFEKLNSGVKVGYGFNYCYEDSILDSNVTENILEVPILKEFLSRGFEINFIGKSPYKFRKFSEKMHDFSSEWKKLPKPYRPISDWIRDCVDNYSSKYEVDFPDVDFVIMNAFPSFFFSNMMFYLINLHYASKGIPVFLWDVEFRTLRTKETESLSKFFRYSGADKIFSKDEFKKIAENSFWLVQIPGESFHRIKSLNPEIRMLSFFPPYWFREDLGFFSLNKNPKYRISYVGNDSERRKTIKKFFTPLSKKNRLHLFGGGMSQRTEGYESFEDYVGNIKMHGPISQDQVWRIYNLSRTCLSIARQRYYDIGSVGHRWFEAILGGSILLLPRDFYGVDKYFNKAFLVDDSGQLEERIDFFNDKIRSSKLIEAHEYQKRFVFKRFSSERNVDTILRAIGR